MNRQAHFSPCTTFFQNCDSCKTRRSYHTQTHSHLTEPRHRGLKAQIIFEIFQIYGCRFFPLNQTLYGSQRIWETDQIVTYPPEGTEAAEPRNDWKAGSEGEGQPWGQRGVLPPSTNNINRTSGSFFPNLPLVLPQFPTISVRPIASDFVPLGNLCTSQWGNSSGGHGTFDPGPQDLAKVCLSMGAITHKYVGILWSSQANPTMAVLWIWVSGHLVPVPISPHLPAIAPHSESVLLTLCTPYKMLHPSPSVTHPKDPACRSMWPVPTVSLFPTFSMF